MYTDIEVERKAEQERDRDRERAREIGRLTMAYLDRFIL